MSVKYWRPATWWKSLSLKSKENTSTFLFLDTWNTYDIVSASFLKFSAHSCNVSIKLLSKTKALHLQGFVIILYNFLSPKLRWIMVSCHLCEPPCQPHSTTAFTSQAKYIFMSVQLKKSPSIYILNTKHFFVKRKRVNTKKNTPVSMHISLLYLTDTGLLNYIISIFLPHRIPSIRLYALYL